MAKKVKDVVESYDTVQHMRIFAIHQTKDECIALFTKNRNAEIVFDSWNEYVKNGTAYQTENDLLAAPVSEIIEIADDWIDLIVYLF
ncbi:hypothetical protein [Streptococcus mutans]|uniref:hypothetical protein n=1 Tax=Streptococcus mutans TaxID=1309 RepID=UPI0002B5AD5C|nr:hypothetical protein [Streptococcus mutans]EMB60908.1 hypothetical protein SMU21_07955 [Streptococcus mutans 1SM1]EMB98823.1 hypothetical protein SMU66_08371 [Streptococcus mutans N34]MCB5062688.1 hypothetical protein [Streptococcus mutans]